MLEALREEMFAVAEYMASTDDSPPNSPFDFDYRYRYISARFVYYYNVYFPLIQERFARLYARDRNSDFETFEKFLKFAALCVDFYIRRSDLRTINSFNLLYLACSKFLARPPTFWQHLKVDELSVFNGKYPAQSPLFNDDEFIFDDYSGELVAFRSYANADYGSVVGSVQYVGEGLCA